ncbi:hypothetical protein ACJJID_06540 [Microbulbifer sp. CnH-101-G]
MIGEVGPGSANKNEAKINIENVLGLKGNSEIAHPKQKRPLMGPFETFKL